MGDRLFPFKSATVSPVCFHSHMGPVGWSESIETGKLITQSIKAFLLTVFIKWANWNTVNSRKFFYKVSVFKIHILRFPLILAGR